MSDYLRDARIKFLTIGKTELAAIDGELKDIVNRVNQHAPTTDDRVSLSYILRYDGVGIIRRDFEEIRRPFNRAKAIERVVFHLTSPRSVINKGKSIQINFDSVNLDNCFLTVADDEETWVDSNFGRLETLLDHYKNGNWLAHSTAVEMLIQLVGVLFGFSLCLIGANMLAPLLKIRHSFFVLFVGAFLIFSNLWTYILVLIGKVRTKNWPLISFKKQPVGIVGQTVIVFIITALLTGLLNISLKILRNISAMAASSAFGS